MQFSNLNYNLYKSFLVVYETQNFSKAAELLFISQPAVSHNIKELEKQLGVPLFYKRANGVNRTAEADSLYKYVSTGFNSIWKGEEQLKHMAGLHSGVVKVGIPSYLTVLFLANSITSFRKKYPDIKIEIFSKPSAELMYMLQTQNVDIVINSNASVFDKDNITSHYLTSFEHCFFTTDKYYSEKQLTSQSINNLPLIISSQNSEEIKLLKNSNSSIRLNPIIESWTTESLIRLVKDGNGVGYCQELYVKKEIESGSLKKLKVSFKLPKLDIYCGYIPENLAFAPKKFIDFLTPKD